MAPNQTGKGIQTYVFKGGVVYRGTFKATESGEPGNPIRLMGFNVGEITKIELNKPWLPRGVTIFFNIRDPYYGYIWWDSKVRVESDFLGHRYLEVEKGRFGAPSVTNNAGDLLVMKRSLAWGKFNALFQQNRSLPENKGLSNDDLTNLVTSNLMALIKS